MTDDRMSTVCRMPTICLSCRQPISAAEYTAHRRHCQADIEADNQRMAGDPVEVLAGQVRLLLLAAAQHGVGVHTQPDDSDRAIALRTKVWAQGWRIAEVAEEWEEDGLDIGVPDRGPHPCWRIAREWFPEEVR